MLIFLPFVIVLSALHFSKQIRINSTVIYIIAMLLSGLSIIPNSNYLYIINSGLLGLAFLLVVMYTGAIPRGSQIKRQLSSVRREFAILGFIFISPHAYLQIYEAVVNITPFEMTGLITYLLLIPLVITSFKVVKKGIRTSRWIKLHRLSYLVYLFLFIHLVSVSYLEDVVFFYVVFGIYTIMKLNNYVFKKHSLVKSTAVTLIIGSMSLVFINDATIYFNEPEDIIEGNSFVDGIYSGTSSGYRNQEVLVTVVIRENKIEHVVVNNCGCSQFIDDGFYSDSAYQIANQIQTENRTDIDSIVGATETTYAVETAVNNALKEALIE